MARVRFDRILKRGSQGKDVSAVQRALKRARYRKRFRTGRFSPVTERQVRHFQKAKRLKADGVYGPRTHLKLLRTDTPKGTRAWDAKCSELYRKARLKDVRALIIAAGMIGVAKRDSIHYTQDARRMQGVRERIRPPHVPSWEDCSSFATWLYWLADAPDPNGRGFDGFGYTGTMILNGQRLSGIGDARPGDLIFYGRDRNGNPTHVAVYAGKGEDGIHRVVSFGSEPGPFFLDYRYRHDLSSIRSYIP